MQIKVYTIDVKIPRWAKRALVFGVIPAILLGAVAVVVAQTSLGTFSDDEVLSATKMNGNFSNLQTQINNLVPAGTVVAFAGATPPAGWLLCDGSAVGRTQYPALFAAITVTYGIGDAVSTFSLPDLRAAGIRGVGASAKFTANTTVALGQVFDDQFQGWQVGVVNGSTYYGQPDSLNSKVSSTAASGWAAPSLHTTYQSATLGMKAVDNGVDGTPRTGAETTGKAIGMNYIIKY